MGNYKQRIDGKIYKQQMEKYIQRINGKQYKQIKDGKDQETITLILLFNFNVLIKYRTSQFCVAY